MKKIYIDFVLDEGAIKTKLHLPKKGYLIVVTPLRISSSQWDYEKQRPFNIYLKASKRINEALDRIRITLATFIREVSDMTSKEIEKGMCLRIGRACRKPAPPSDRQTLLHHVHAYIQTRKHLLSPSTLKRYCVFLALLQRFEGYSMRHFTLREVDASFVQQFLAFGVRENYSVTTLHRSIAFVRTILIFLEKRGKRTMAHELELPRVRKRNKPVSLSEQELDVIRNTVLPSHLHDARAWLLISCYTGQRISDVMRFHREMLYNLQETTCISFCQQKTAKDILLPLHPEVQRLMKQYGHAFPHPIPLDRYNRFIREIAKAAGLNTVVECNLRQNHRGSRKIVPKWQALTSHVGRRSFATNFYGKIPTSLLMKATGHASESMFQRYVDHRNCEQVLSLAAYLAGKAS